MTSHSRFPFSANIKDILQFYPNEGQIKLGSERVVIFSQNAIGLLRSLMQDQLGPLLSRMLLSQFGYQQGLGDYQTLSQMYEWGTDQERLAAGPLMHAWSGSVQVEPLEMEMDRESGHFYFRGLWHRSYEAEIYLERFGISSAPVCYTLAGYGSGWCSAFFGKPLLEIEKRCIAAGDNCCEWEIRPWDSWGSEADLWKKSLLATSDSLYQDLLMSHQKILHLNLNLEKEVERRTEENRKLLRMICHDLVVPISAIIQCSANLRPSLTDLDAIKSYDSLLKFAHMIESLLSDAKQSEARATGKISAYSEIFSLDESIETMHIMFKNLIASKQIKIVFENHLEKDDFVFAPKATFNTNILSNVVSNAIKFSPLCSSIFISATRVNKEMRIVVRDEGIGIPPRLRPHLFSDNVPTSRVGTNGEQGTGFGLPIVKSFVEKIGGRIEVVSVSLEEDSKHHGTSIIIYMPMAKKPETRQDEPPGSPST